MPTSSARRAWRRKGLRERRLRPNLKPPAGNLHEPMRAFALALTRDGATR